MGNWHKRETRPGFSELNKGLQTTRTANPSFDVPRTLTTLLLSNSTPACLYASWSPDGSIRFINSPFSRECCMARRSLLVTGEEKSLKRSSVGRLVIVSCALTLWRPPLACSERYSSCSSWSRSGRCVRFAR